MGKALEKICDLRDMKNELDSEVVSYVQSALDDLVRSTVPLPKDSFASDYRSKYVDYTVVLYLANGIINSELHGIKPARDELRLYRS